MHQDKRRTRTLSRGLRLLTTTLLPTLGLALLIAAMAHQLQPVRAGAANVWWVDGVNGNDGNSCSTPESPCATIGGAMGKAVDGDLIHVAAGTYPENLEITKSLSLVGGFDANWLRERGDRSTVRPDSGRVVKISHNRRITTAIVGFTLTGGAVQYLSPGAGLLAVDAHVTMEDCVVADNHVRGIRWGGGIYFEKVEARLTDIDLFNNTITGTSALAVGGGIAIRAGSEVVIADSRIISNSAGGGGGGIYVGDIWGGGSSLTLLRTQVISNMANGNGGGLLVDPGDEDVSHLTMAGNLFRANVTEGGGGALFAVGDNISIAATANRTISNTASGGGGWYLDGHVVVSVNGDSFQGNTATQGGGLVLGSVAITSTFQGLQVIGNQATDGKGGGLYVEERLTLVKANLVGNSAGGDGGGLYAASGNQRVALIASRVVSNSAGLGGGVAGRNMEAYRVHFTGNRSSDDGGAIGVQSSIAVVTLTNSVLAWNTAAGDGGGLFFNGDEARVFNNTFVGDVTSASHSIYLDLYDDSDSEAWAFNNVIVGHEVGVQKTTTGTLNIGYNDLWDNDDDYVGTGGGSGSTSVDPEFADRDGGDFHLSSSSPGGVLDSASSTYAPPDDYDGQSRPQGSGDDKGADEYTSSGGCSDDGYEDDSDAYTSAPALGAGTYDGLQICPDDPDWYKVNVPRGATLEASLDFDHSGGDLDVILLDENLQPLDAGLSNDDDEQVEVTAPTSGTYYLHVYGVNLGMGGASNDYDLSIQITGLCSDDGYEQNDTAAGAAGLGSGIYGGLHICPYDPDFYRLTLPADKVLTVTLSHDAEAGDLDLWLYSPGGVYTDSSLSLTDQERVSLTTTETASKTAFIRVCGYADGQCGPTPVENDYTLDVLILHNGPGVELFPDRSGDADPHEMVVYQHTLRNVGNQTDAFTLTAKSGQNWPLQISAPPALGPGVTAAVHVTLTVPAGTTADLEDTTVVTATSQRDPSYTALVTDTTTVNYVSDITWDGARVHSDVVPPATLVYSHTLTNDGNAADTFDLGVNTPAGINATLSESSLAIGQGASASFVVTLEVAAYPTIQDGIYDVTLTATSGRDSNASQDVVDQVDVDVVTGVNLDGPFSFAHTRPLSTVLYSHVVSNVGNVTDSFALDLAAPSEITATLGQSSLLLGPHAHASVPITLEIGAYPPVVSGTYPVTLTATSNYNSAVTAQVVDPLQVDVLTGAAMDAPRLFTYTRPLSTVVYSHVLTNTGEFTDRFSLTPQAPSGITVTLSDDHFELGPGIDASFAITLELGPYPQVVSRTYGITLTAVSDWDPDASAQIVDRVHVHVVAGLELDEPIAWAHTRPLSTVVYSHVLTNTGEFAETVALTATHHDGIAVTFDPDQLSLNPYASTSFSVTLEMGPYPAVVSDTYGITITTQSVGNPDANAQVVDQVSVDVVTGVDLDGPVITSTHPSETVIYVHRLTNRGDVPDLFSLSTSAPAGITASLSSDQLLLGPGATQPFTVTLEVADYPTIVGGVYEVTVEAVSDYDAAVNATVVDQVEVIHHGEVMPYAIMLPLVLRDRN